MDESIARMSPLMRQYLSLKRKYPDAILFFRVGDFYETYGKDAILVSKELGIALTVRDRERDRTPMAGVPHHAAEPYIAKLVRRGYKVAIAEQLEEPSPKKKLVRRDVVRIITPGTVIEETILEDKFNNYLAGVVKAKKGYGVAFLDISTSEFFTTQLVGDRALDDLLTELSRFSPAEIVLPESLYADKEFVAKIREYLERVAFTPYPDYHFDYEFARETLLQHFKVTSLEGFGCEGMPLAVSAAGAVLSYVLDTQKMQVENIKTLKTYHVAQYMILDGTTIRNLELLQNFRDLSTRGTLLEVLDKTVTSMGSRLLKRWILQPLINVKEINRRLDAVEELVNNSFLREEIRELLDEVYDIERIISRLNLGRLNPKDMIALKESLKRIPQIADLLKDTKSDLLREIREDLNGLPEIVDLIERAIVDDPPPTVQEGGIIKDGFNEELDKLREVVRKGKQWILELEQRERARTGIKSLKVGYNKVFGYYIEVPKSQANRVPKDYIRKQTLTNAERFITPELKEYEAQVLNAEDRIKELEYQIFQEIRNKVCEKTEEIQKTAKALATLDVLTTFAKIAVEYNYVRPIVDDSDVIEIKAGRHPVVEQMIEEDFVPNDAYLNNTTDQILIVTGPNMAGKSTYLRQVALIVLLAQMGCFVPAKYARIGVVDRIFTRVGAVDDITKRQSTFMVEMLETANILNNATSRSLIILDEIGRGTSTFDGMSIAWAVIEYIHNRIGAKTLFATHYHHLTQIEQVLPRVKNYHVAVAEVDGKMIFLRKVKPGPSDRSYGIQVAKLAGLPPEVISRAEEILHLIEEQSNIRIPVEKISSVSAPEYDARAEETVASIEDLMPEIEVKEDVKRKIERMREERVEEAAVVEEGEEVVSEAVTMEETEEEKKKKVAQFTLDQFIKK